MGFFKSLARLLGKISVSLNFTKNETKSGTSTPPINIQITNENNVGDKLGKIAKLFFIVEPKDSTSGTEIEEFIIEAKNEMGKPVGHIPITITTNKEKVVLHGELTKLTDKTGKAVFNKIVINKTGNYKLLANYGEVNVYSESFHIYPPASEIDFQKYAAGSDEETASFITAALEKKNPKDKIIYNGEEC